MGLFSKKNKETKQFLECIDGQHVEYCLERDKTTYEETIVGKSGHIIVKEDEVVIICEAHEVFRCAAEELKGGEFLSGDGVTVTGTDINTGKERTIAAYYKYYRK